MSTTAQSSLLRFDASEEGLVTLTIDAGDQALVILNRELLGRLDATLAAIEARDDITGLILRSASDRVFVAGADLTEIDSLDDQALHAYLAYGTTVFARLANLPCPSVAVINGAVLGGGLELAMHCDGLVLSEHGSNGKPYQVGLPEAGLGLCPGWGGTQTLPARIDPTTAFAAAATGTTFKSDALPEGLADTLVKTPAELFEAAEAFLAARNSPAALRCIGPQDADRVAPALASAIDQVEHTEAAGAVFAAAETGLGEGWAAAVAMEQCELVRLRSTETARQRLAAFFARNRTS
ncbi:MAG: enoyl-CoA hydratase-related protein [Phycisphaerales bacterium]|nr:enoyl-CoA hydratase-related protein [Phycisphaerales bacterium]